MNGQGGKRQNSGRKPKDLKDSVSDGKAKKAKVLSFQVPIEEETVQADDYLSAEQVNGEKLKADLIYSETFEWLKARGCAQFVNPRLVESYAEAFARFIQCEREISKGGLVSRRGTGAECPSPFVTMSLNYQKQANMLWCEIFDIVRQNCSTEYGSLPQEDMMDKLLRERKG